MTKGQLLSHPRWLEIPEETVLGVIFDEEVFEIENVYLSPDATYVDENGQEAVKDVFLFYG